MWKALEYFVTCIIDVMCIDVDSPHTYALNVVFTRYRVWWWRMIVLNAIAITSSHKLEKVVEVFLTLLVPASIGQTLACFPGRN